MLLQRELVRLPWSCIQPWGGGTEPNLLLYVLLIEEGGRVPQCHGLVQSGSVSHFILV